ncbi:hypothetical protein [Paenibacillus cymbidii]|uniref:hypothetical protein n=1 Tax=Paenibacillus cymbidii TaxID=1639034 RepID=UPI001081620D|nr:hypothetical protein [Paenibacillus cymbidii]
MNNKWTLAAVALGTAIVCCGAFATKAAAEPLYVGNYEPDGLRFPATIELLANTPYYASPDQPADEPEGAFAPQTVRVIRTQSSWSIGQATWEIETMFGPRWIRPKPWEIDIAPPSAITLLEETPLYRRADESGGPVAALAPQEVKVTGAEKQWFYTNDPNRPAWIQIHTTWMGDLWAHIPVNKIGTEQPLERKAHYYWLPDEGSLASAMGVASPAQDMLPGGDFAVAREYTTIYGRAYQVQTASGPTWTQDRGFPLLPVDETIELQSETPLLADIWDSARKETAVLKGGKATVFEKVEGPLSAGFYRGIPPVWYNGPWYHVRTPQGTGWINPLYGEPSAARPVHWRVDLAYERALQRYPDVPFAQSGAEPTIGNRTVEATAAWADPGEARIWLKATVDGTTGWFAVWTGGGDRIWDEDAGTALQIMQAEMYNAGMERTADGKETLFDGTAIGYRDSDGLFLDSILLASILRFKSERLPYVEAVEISQNDYSFVLQAGTREAHLYWHGTMVGTKQLRQLPRHDDAAWYMDKEDARELFGLAQYANASYTDLVAAQYRVELGALPTVAKGGKLVLNAFVYEAVNRTAWAQSRLPLRLSLEENGDGGAAFAEQLALPANDATGALTLMRLHAERTLAPGPHQIDATLRVGERIVWRQTFHVTAE